MSDLLDVKRSPEVKNYFLPRPSAPVGSIAENEGKIPKLFEPLIIKNLKLNNRVLVSPMCTYSAPFEGPHVGEPTDFHKIHYGSFALRGAGAIIIEATAVVPEGRLSPEDLGLWTDEQAYKFKEIVDFVHAQGSKIGVQLGHGGRKASGVATPLFLQHGIGSRNYGWNDIKGKFVGPSAISYGLDSYPVPQELTIEEIEDLVRSFKKAADRAYNIAGFDFVEIHGAHGYLVSSFLSGTSNKRSDKYGGSLENRSRLLLEIVDAIKTDEHPLFVRISSTELADDQEGAWTIKDSVALSDLLIEHGVDLLDVSAGGNNAKQLRAPKFDGYQIPYAKEIKEHVKDKLLIGSW